MISLDYNTQHAHVRRLAQCSFHRLMHCGRPCPSLVHYTAPAAALCARRGKVHSDAK